jgi:hypothetical protein
MRMRVETMIRMIRVRVSMSMSMRIRMRMMDNKEDKGQMHCAWIYVHL